jgi:hypothetical protein
MHEDKEEALCSLMLKMLKLTSNDVFISLINESKILQFNYGSDVTKLKNDLDYLTTCMIEQHFDA